MCPDDTEHNQYKYMYSYRIAQLEKEFLFLCKTSTKQNTKIVISSKLLLHLRRRNARLSQKNIRREGEGEWKEERDQSVQLRLAIEYPVAVSYCMLASCYSDTR